MMNKQYIKNICIMYNDVYDMCTTESGAVPDEGAAPRTRKKKTLACVQDLIVQDHRNGQLHCPGQLRTWL
jgi:hypothetical protein